MLHLLTSTHNIPTPNTRLCALTSRLQSPVLHSPHVPYSGSAASSAAASPSAASAASASGSSAGGGATAAYALSASRIIPCAASPSADAACCIALTSFSGRATLAPAPHNAAAILRHTSPGPVLRQLVIASLTVAFKSSVFRYAAMSSGGLGVASRPSSSASSNGLPISLLARKRPVREESFVKAVLPAAS